MNEPMKPKLGLLPLTLELYQEYKPELEKKQRPFIGEIADSFGVFAEVTTAPVCATTGDVRRTIGDFESNDVDMIVVLFISYATSISALNPLLETRLPLLLFSTTPKSSMAGGMTTEDIMCNHGVHGYMDLANVLKRNRRQFLFVSGTRDDVRTLEEIASWSRAAQVKKRLRRSNIGLAGYTFDGMGDFGIDTTSLNAVLGPEVRHVALNDLADFIGNVDDGELDEECERDMKKYTIEPSVDRAILRESNRVYLGLKTAVAELSLNAFSMHFQGILEHPHIRTLPFLAVSKLQEQGLAYAGEGDLLGATANLMLRYLCGDTVFTETFCPDFDGGRIVMGHMGESNPAFGGETVLRRKKFQFGRAIDPVIAEVSMEEGRATVLNLGVVEEGAFQMIVYTGAICEKIPGAPDIDMPYFHFKPDGELPDFLTAYGKAGGTHHIGLTRGERTGEVMMLAELLGIQSIILM